MSSGDLYGSKMFDKHWKLIRVLRVRGFGSVYLAWSLRGTGSHHQKNLERYYQGSISI